MQQKPIDLHQDALEFTALSTQYRLTVAEIGKDSKQAKDIMADIKKLVIFDAERLMHRFKLKIEKQGKVRSKRRGIIIPELTLQKRLMKRQQFDERDIVTLDPFGKKNKIGINLMLDYSGSMWFDSRTDSIDGIQRIHAQNFLTLILACYLEMISKQDMKITITPFCREPLVHEYNSIINKDWDTFIIFKGWGSYSNTSSGSNGNPDTETRKRMPEQLKKWNEADFCNEYPLQAFEKSLGTFKKEKMNSFINIFITDGGMHRLGETETDRIAFLESMAGKIRKISGINRSKSAFILIKEQNTATRQLLTKARIPFIKLNDKKEYNNVFIMLGHLIEQVMSSAGVRA